MSDLLLNDDQPLSLSCRELPANDLHPLPSSQWPEENIALYHRYREWLFAGGAGYYSATNNYIPIAGHILGLNPIPYQKLDLDKDFEKVLAFVRARGCSEFRFRMANLALKKFRKFVQIELGMKEAPRFKPFSREHFIQGLPAWLVADLERYQRSLERNWRPARVMANLSGFWSKQGKMWRFLCDTQGVEQFADLKRAHILALVDHLLDEKFAISTINCYILILRGFLLFLQQEGYTVPHTLLRVQTLKVPDNLPKYLKDDEIIRLRDAIRAQATSAMSSRERRQFLLDQAIFYVLWHGGLRLDELEELRMEDLDLPGKRLVVRNGKGQKDRTIYLTGIAASTLQDYLDVRGGGGSDHVFLYRHAALNKSFVGSRLKTLGEKAGVRLYAHQLRHTCATQLLNAGCQITSIQKILGHKNINTTLIYAKAYNQTVADDFYAAMERVEERLSFVSEETEVDETEKEEVVKVQEWVERLSCPDLALEERLEIAWDLKEVLQGLASNHMAAAPPG